MSWRDDAACLGMPLDLFFPDGRHDEAVAEAKRVCEGCPVLRHCGTFAQRVRPQFGIFAGLSAYDRRKIRESA